MSRDSPCIGRLTKGCSMKSTERLLEDLDNENEALREELEEAESVIEDLQEEPEFEEEEIEVLRRGRRFPIEEENERLRRMLQVTTSEAAGSFQIQSLKDSIARLEGKLTAPAPAPPAPSAPDPQLGRLVDKVDTYIRELQSIVKRPSCPPPPPPPPVITLPPPPSITLESELLKAVKKLTKKVEKIGKGGPPEAPGPPSDPDDLFAGMPLGPGMPGLDGEPDLFGDMPPGAGLPGLGEEEETASEMQKELEKAAEELKKCLAGLQSKEAEVEEISKATEALMEQLEKLKNVESATGGEVDMAALQEENQKLQETLRKNASELNQCYIDQSLNLVEKQAALIDLNEAKTRSEERQKLVDQLQEQIGELTQKLVQMQSIVTDLGNQRQILEGQIANLGDKIPTPEEVESIIGTKRKVGTVEEGPSKRISKPITDVDGLANTDMWANPLLNFSTQDRINIWNESEKIVNQVPKLVDSGLLGAKIIVNRLLKDWMNMIANWGVLTAALKKENLIGDVEGARTFVLENWTFFSWNVFNMVYGIILKIWNEVVKKGGVTAEVTEVGNEHSYLAWSDSMRKGNPPNIEFFKTLPIDRGEFGDVFTKLVSFPTGDIAAGLYTVMGQPVLKWKYQNWICQEGSSLSVDVIRPVVSHLCKMDANIIGTIPCGNVATGSVEDWKKRVECPSS